jgi:hypothetical protein
MDGCGVGVRVLGGARICSLQDVETGSEAHPASYAMCTGALSPGVKRPGREAGHLPPISAEVKSSVSVHPHPICLHGMVFN